MNQPFPRARLFLLVALLLLSGSALSLNLFATPDRRIVFNDDGQVLWEAPEKGTIPFITDWLDREATAVPFNTFVFQAALPDICVYQTKVGEVYGKRLGPKFNRAYARTLRVLKAQGTDPLHVATKHMKAKGMEVLAAVRLSDTHHTAIDPANPLCPKFAIDHPEYIIKQPDGRTNETALDYSHPEVRAHRLAIMREIIENYDVDGLELNFVRWAKHFPRHKGREKSPIFTAYMGQIREMLDEVSKKRGGKKLTLGMRVPESIDTCWLAGIDIHEWIKRRYPDFIIVSTWNNTDPQMPVDEFVKFAKPAGIPVLAVMGNMMGAVWAGVPLALDRGVAMSAKHHQGYQGMLLTPAEARAAAANYYAWGAESISFWNVGIHFGRLRTATPEQRLRTRQWALAVADPQKVFAGPREYHYLPMGKGMAARKPPVRNYPFAEEGRSPLGRLNSPVLTFSGEKSAQRQAFPFRMAEGGNGKDLKGKMRFWVYHITVKDRVNLDLNGRRIDPSRVKRFGAGKQRGGLPGQRFEIDLTHCPTFRADNELGLKLPALKSRVPAPFMEELIIRVK